MSKKPIKEGYKVFGIADHGYLYTWIWSSREKGLQAIFKYPILTLTGSLVCTLAFTLPRQQLTIYIDNYFISIPLFIELQACKFSIMGTTHPYKAFPDSLSIIKKRFTKKLPWNTLLVTVEQDILCLAWQDNNIILVLNNIHIVNKVEDIVERKRRYPIKILTNGYIIREVFGTDSIKEFRIPCFINNYNYNIEGINLANQFREVYETHKPSLRNWWPLFYWLIDIAYINSYILYRLYTIEKYPLSHLQFRQELARKLLSYSEKVKL